MEIAPSRSCLCYVRCNADETASRSRTDQVERRYAACHSLDYIQMNAPFPDQKLWEAEVTKMIKVFGAPIDDAEARLITDYLSRNYGSGGPT